jgi:hypothetical protein
MTIIAVCCPTEIADLWHSKLQNNIFGLDVSVNIAHSMHKSKSIAKAFGDWLDIWLLKSSFSFEFRENRTLRCVLEKNIEKFLIIEKSIETDDVQTF